jgi:DNA-binding XRE family transcriptional regulator
MGVLTARVKHAERMMTQATAVGQGIEITFADDCKGLIPFKDIPEIGNPAGLSGIELPNPYQVNIRGSKDELVELPWDFVRDYCDAGYRSQVESIASEGRQALGKRIRAIRESIGMTQSELAESAKIGRVTEVRIENGEQSPRYETLLAIARALKRPVTDLLTDTAFG